MPGSRAGEWGFSVFFSAPQESRLVSGGSAAASAFSFPTGAPGPAGLLRLQPGRAQPAPCAARACSARPVGAGAASQPRSTRARGPEGLSRKPGREREPLGCGSTWVRVPGLSWALRGWGRNPSRLSPPAALPGWVLAGSPSLLQGDARSPPASSPHAHLRVRQGTFPSFTSCRASS